MNTAIENIRNEIGPKLIASVSGINILLVHAFDTGWEALSSTKPWTIAAQSAQPGISSPEGTRQRLLSTNEPCAFWDCPNAFDVHSDCMGLVTGNWFWRAMLAFLVSHAAKVKATKLYRTARCCLECLNVQWNEILPTIELFRVQFGYSVLKFSFHLRGAILLWRLTYFIWSTPFFPQNISILNQAEIDKFLCDLDGTKDKSLFALSLWSKNTTATF